MKKKECLKKQCYHLQKNEQHAVWKQWERMKEIRKERKLAIAS